MTIFGAWCSLMKPRIYLDHESWFNHVERVWLMVFKGTCMENEWYSHCQNTMDPSRQAVYLSQNGAKSLYTVQIWRVRSLESYSCNMEKWIGGRIDDRNISKWCFLSHLLIHILVAAISPVKTIEMINWTNRGKRLQILSWTAVRYSTIILMNSEGSGSR